MPSYAHQLARLRVAAATGQLPTDLGRWALELITAIAPCEERRALRDALLRAAGELVGGSARARARALESELAAVERCRRPRGDLRRLLAEVLELDPRTPRSERQLRRILGWDTEGGGDVPGSRDRA